VDVDREAGLLSRARYVASPHSDERPGGTGVDLLVIHGISLPPGEFGGPWIERLFLGHLDPAAHPALGDLGGLRVSAHLLVRRSGAVVQYVPFHRRAWHCGVSSWQGRERCNDFSVGIEVEGADGIPYLAPQYRALAAATAALGRAYPAITADRVVGHADVAPGRKSDPWASFDWGRYQELAAGLGRPFHRPPSSRGS
jgi:AmpD protein